MRETGGAVANANYPVDNNIMCNIRENSGWLDFMEMSRLRMFMHEWSQEEDISLLLTSLLASLLSFFITVHFYFTLPFFSLLSKFSPNFIFFLLFILSTHVYHIAFCLQKSSEYLFGAKMLCWFSPHAHSSTSACCSDIKSASVTERAQFLFDQQTFKLMLEPRSENGCMGGGEAGE